MPPAPSAPTASLSSQDQNKLFAANARHRYHLPG